jgi:hypothetical protein
MVIKKKSAAGEQKKNSHAAALSKLGAARGGEARAANLEPSRRKEIASAAAKARWKNGKGAIVKATHAGTLHIGEMVLECANLPDGRRVVSEATMLKALDRGYSGYYSQRDANADPDSVLPRYLAPAALRQYISEDLHDLLTKPVGYLMPNSNLVAKGVAAEVIPKICNVWLKARADGKLSDAQLRTATRAEMLVSGLAEVGIAALIDAATGYEKVRDKQALQAILDAFLRTELAAWAKRFPDEFYQQIFRLRNWTWKGMHVNRPHAVAHWTKDLVYARLAPGILQELEERMPRNALGKKAGKFHQLLTDDVGHPALAQHLHALIGLMRVAQSWEQLIMMVDLAFPKRGDTLQLPFMADPVLPMSPEPPPAI